MLLKRQASFELEGKRGSVIHTLAHHARVYGLAFILERMQVLIVA